MYVLQNDMTFCYLDAYMVDLDERLRGPQTITLNKADQSKANPKTGASQLEWNQTGSLLLVRFGELPLIMHWRLHSILRRNYTNCRPYLFISFSERCIRRASPIRPSAFAINITSPVEPSAKGSFGSMLC